MVARLAPGAGAVARALDATRRFARAHRLPQTTADRLAVIVEEWVANIVEHGRPRAGSLIGFRMERARGAVRMTFTDAGIAFDPRSAQDKGPNLERGGGAGIALIRSWSEIEGYSRRSGRNRLALRSKS
ncbi:ATP-binding protein [Phenylobacterium sp.]|uniref:ATP-binding protein n=1 Tax=Phenylobacterium sp. TaxID=1871053 RepID=UPI0025CC06E8|nr:ATP-binding protein [Phenylobacterium sp.]